MPVTVKNISEVFGKDVFTNRGAYCGKVEDIDISLIKFRVSSVRVETARGSFLGDMLGGKKGVIVPYQLVESIGDVVIIKHVTPTMPESQATSAEDMVTPEEI
jgi:sporulation protein YlmC with PRC-barrel domain